MEEDMAHTARKVPPYVIGPDGGPLTLSDLPSAGTKRWVSRRKAEVVSAVNGGLLSLDEACRRYSLSIEEFISWQRAFDRYGQRGLRATSSRPRLTASDLRVIEK
jgi:hypothetical protein